MFIGRKAELGFLNNCYNSPNAEFVVLYGRRRIGKTETLSEFCRDKESVFYSSRECTDSVQLQSFSKALFSLDIPAKNYINSFVDWDSAFSALADIQSDKKTVIVIDEFPYMCKNNPSIPSTLQNIWDHKLKNSNIMLVLCGSSMSFMENEILASKNPLYGRATGIYKMLPMVFDDAIQFFPHYSNEDKVIAYSILGGIPHYLRQFNPELSLEENIKNKILTKGTVLYNEIEFLLRQELRETSLYNSIIEAIALGNTSLNEIYQKLQIDKAKLSVYLKNLIDLGIIEREFSVLSNKSQHANTNKGLYKLTDNFFCFWYAFAYSNFSDLEGGFIDDIYDNYIQNELHHFASKTFENICIFYLKKQNLKKTLPFKFTEIGRWWGNVTHKDDNNKPYTVAEEIDILASDSSQKNYIIGECKFTNEKIDNGILEQLKLKYPNAGNTNYYLFSLNGFTKTLIDRAKEEQNIKLISLNDILNN